MSKRPIERSFKARFREAKRGSVSFFLNEEHFDDVRNQHPEIFKSPVWLTVDEAFDKASKKRSVISCRNRLTCFLADLAVGMYDIDKIEKQVQKDEEERTAWLDASKSLCNAANLQGLPLIHYIRYQPYPFKIAVEDPVGDALRRASKYIGTRGGVANKESAMRGFVARFMADDMPMDELDTPYACISELASIVGIDLTPKLCRAILNQKNKNNRPSIAVDDWLRQKF